jgi:hypothetical protein
LVLLRPERVTDEVINGALDRGVIAPVLGADNALGTLLDYGLLAFAFQ